MKPFPRVALLALLFAPACQTAELEETVRDQDRQLEIARQERTRLAAERDRIQSQNAELQDRLLQEQQQNSDLMGRLQAMEAQAASMSYDAAGGADAEVEGLQESLAGTGVGVGRRGGYIVLDLPSAITFPSGSATLSRQGETSLAAVAQALRANYADRTFWVEGHTDNDPIKKSKWETNLRLSVERAMAVAAHLTGKLGLDPAAVRVAGHGEYAPKDSNDTKEGKASNRRVEILILD